MIRYLEGSKFSFKLEPEFPRLDEALQNRVHENWQNTVRVNPKLFDGGIYCAHRVETTADGGWEVGVNRGRYSVYKTTRGEGLLIPGTYAMGTGVFFYDAGDDSFVFVERSQDLSFDNGKISMAAGGVVDWDPKDPQWQDPKDFYGYIKSQAKKEIEEEMTTDNMGELKALGAYEDDQTLKVEFAFITVVNGYELRGDENIRLVKVKRGEVAKFLEENRDRLEGSTLGHLSHWAERFDKWTQGESNP